MDVILLERVAKLGQMGDVVTVKNGYARNFLLPNGKALRANETNKAHFDRDKTQLEARNLEARNEAETVGDKLNGETFVAIRQAGETGQLYGSVAPRDVAELLSEGGFSVERSQVRLDRPIKTIGMQEVLVVLHPEVEVPVTINVARSTDEAERQALGEDLTGRDQYADDDEGDEEVPDLEEIFENAEDAEAAVEAEADVDADSDSNDAPSDDVFGEDGDVGEGENTDAEPRPA
jgi:large subunit ribosomal protein L9